MSDSISGGVPDKDKAIILLEARNSLQNMRVSYIDETYDGRLLIAFDNGLPHFDNHCLNASICVDFRNIRIWDCKRGAVVK